MNRDALVEWFKALFAARTPPKSVLEAHSSYRVMWSEIRQRMLDLGWVGNVVDQRLEWDRIYVECKLVAWRNRVLREAGEKPLPRRYRVD